MGVDRDKPTGSFNVEYRRYRRAVEASYHMGAGRAEKHRMPQGACGSSALPSLTPITGVLCKPRSKESSLTHPCPRQSATHRCLRRGTSLDSSRKAIQRGWASARAVHAFELLLRVPPGALTVAHFSTEVNKLENPYSDMENPQGEARPRPPKP